MNSMTVCVVYIWAVVLVRVSNASYEVFSEQKTTHNAPFNFRYNNWKDFLVMEITLKNIPPSVTAVYAIYSIKNFFYQNDLKATSRREKVEAEIKNGEVKFNIQRSIKEKNILVDVELHTRDGLCRTSRVAEGRYPSEDWLYGKNGYDYVYWYTGWNHDDTGSCVVPKPCEIVMDFKNRCQEDLNCYVKEKKYICALQSEKLDNLKSYLYQTYDTDKPRTNVTLRKDYKYLAAVDSYYKIHKETKPWHDAKRICAQEGGILFYPENSAEAKAVISFWKLTAKDYLWVGISDTITEGEFVTVDGRPISEVHNIWRTSQPDNYKNEDCVHMYLNDSQYNDIQCNVTWCSFICKRSSIQNIQINLSSVIGAPLDSSAINTRLIFDSELFDNNTSVNSVAPGSGKLQRSERIILKTEDVVPEYIVRAVTYSETTEVQFSCEEYKNWARPKYLFVALINTTKEKIQTLNETEKVKRTFKMAENGSILCCLYYVYESANSGEELEITRFVINKTLLIYKPEVPTSALNAAEIQDLAQSTESNDYSWLLYILPAFLGVTALTLALCVLSKRRRWFQKSQPAEETVELDNHAQQNQVLYASLDLVGNRNQPQKQNEESHYAEIVGVLKPH